MYVSSARFDSVVEGRVKMSDLCIGCSEVDVQAEHPLFEGGLCKECKVRKSKDAAFCKTCIVSSYGLLPCFGLV